MAWPKEEVWPLSVESIMLMVQIVPDILMETTNLLDGDYHRWRYTVGIKKFTFRNSNMHRFM